MAGDVTTVPSGARITIVPSGATTVACGAATTVSIFILLLVLLHMIMLKIKIEIKLTGHLFLRRCDPHYRKL